MPPRVGFGAGVGKVLRISLALAAGLLILWSFVRVGSREARRFLTHSDDIELVVLHWSSEAGPEEDEIVERSLRAFEAAHPGIVVRRINPGDSNSFYTKLQTMLASGDPPDVFYVGSERVASFASLGLLHPLDEFVEDSQAGMDLDEFFPQTVDAFRYDGKRIGEGPLYGVPKDFTTLGFYINKDLFRRAGIDVPSPDWSWDDYVRIARTLGSLEGITGSEFVTWPMIIRAYLRTEGVDVQGADFGDIRLRDPEVRAALDRLRSWRHDERGTLTSGKSKLASGSAIFATGTVGMAGPFGRWVVPEYRRIRDFEWDFVPLPHGAARSNVIVTVAWAVAERSRHKREAWELVRWLTSAEGQAEQARLGLAIPTNRDVAASDAFIDPAKAPASDEAYLAPLRDPRADVRVIDWPADPAFESLLGSRLDEAILTAAVPLDRAISNFEQAWQTERQSPLRQSTFPLMPWRALAWAGIVALAAVVTVASVLFLRRRGRGPSERRESDAGVAMASPWIVGFVLFLAFPIAMSFCLSLASWKGITTLDQARFVGVGNYSQLLLHDQRFRTSLWVTFYYTLIAVPGGQIVALVAAVLLTPKVRGIPIFRAAWYLPSVIAGVGVAVLWRWMFDPEVGLINAALRPLLALVGARPPEWFGEDAAVWGPPAFAIMSMWMIGGSMIVYLAGLQGVPRDLLEAAEIDGAGRVRRFFAVTLPLLSPVVLFNTLMALIGSFQVFTQAYVMTAGEPGDRTRFYVLYLYNQAFDFYEMGYASAMAWILLVIILAITFVLLRSSARVVYYEALRQ